MFPQGSDPVISSCYQLGDILQVRGVQFLLCKSLDNPCKVSSSPKTICFYDTGVL